MPVAALASDAAGFASAIGNRAFATAVAEAGGTAPLQRSSVDELRVRAAKGASDDAAIGELGILDKHQGITDAELDALHIDDVKALRRHTNALIEHHIQGHKSDDVPFWVEPAKLFVARRLEPRLAVKLRGGETARLFWPIVEKLNETLGDGRIGKALLNVLPHAHRYLSTMTGKAPAADAPSAQELGRIGTLGARFEIARLKWSREDSVPTPAELVATFDNAPRRFATLFADAVTEEDVLAAFKASEVDPGSVSVSAADVQARADARLTRLASQIKTKLLEQDEDWRLQAESFQELVGIDIGGMPRAVKYALFKVTELAGDDATVMSCYWAVDDPPPELSQEQRFERALTELSGGRPDAGGGPLVPSLGAALAGLTSRSGGATEARLNSGAWVEVQVVGERDGRYQVHPLGLTSEHDEVVDAEHVRPKSSWSKGEEVRILHGGTLYPCRVLDTRAQEPRVKVHWYGYSETQQSPEWVATQDVRQN